MIDYLTIKLQPSKRNVVYSKINKYLSTTLYFGIFIVNLYFFSYFTVALADEYQCTVVWATGEYNGSGDSLGDAIDDARDECHSDHDVTEHECGASPVNTNCIDEDGKCVSHAEFLQHGLAGGDACG